MSTKQAARPISRPVPAIAGLVAHGSPGAPVAFRAVSFSQFTDQVVSQLPAEDRVEALQVLAEVSGRLMAPVRAC